MSKEKKASFMKGAAILSIAGLIVKILGAIYRIPIGNIIKTEGMGYYQTAYPFYMLLTTISTAGFPVAIAKLVSERRALEDYEGAHRVFKVSLVGLSLIGLITSLFVFFMADRMVIYLGNSKAYYSLIALAPALLFIPIMSAFRGFFQGNQNMNPTAISQIAEQLFRVISGLLLTYMLLDIGIPEAAGGASFGGSVGAFVGMLVILLIYLRNRKDIEKEKLSGVKTYDYKVKDIIKDLLIIAIPITIGAAITPIMDTIDAKLVLTRLQTINYTEAQANDLYGQLKGFAQTLVNLPQVFSVAIGMSIVPAISEAMTKKDKKTLDKSINSGIRMTVLLGMPSTVGLFVLARPIINLLYFNNTPEVIASTGEILMYSSIGVIFVTLVQTLTSILQGLGKPMIPVYNLFIGAVVKAYLTYQLTVIPSINVKGAAISTVVAFAIASILNMIGIIRYHKFKFDFIGLFIKPLISSLGMGLIVHFSFKLFLGLGQNIATLLSIVVGGISYIILLLVTKSFTREDILLLPKGEKIADILKL